MFVISGSHIDTTLLRHITLTRRYRVPPGFSLSQCLFLRREHTCCNEIHAVKRVNYKRQRNTRIPPAAEKIISLHFFFVGSNRGP